MRAATERRILAAVAVSAFLTGLAVLGVASVRHHRPGPAPAEAVRADERAAERPLAKTSTRRRGWVPKRLRIPRIGVNAKVLALGMGRGGPRVPSLKQVDDLGWFDRSARIGEPGNAVMFGHFDSPDGPAVLARAKELRPGDEIVVSGGRRSRRYLVTSRRSIEKHAFPAEEIYRTRGRPGLTLVTCGGLYDPRRRNYTHNLIVTAEPRRR